MNITGIKRKVFGVGECCGEQKYQWGFLISYGNECEKVNWLGNPSGKSALCPDCASRSHGPIPEEHMVSFPPITLQ